MKTVNISLSLVVPAVNEEEIIQKTVETYYKKLKKLVERFEIIVVDDGSTDQTPRILQKLMLNNRNLRVVTHKKNEGVGKAIWDGFKKARYAWVMHNSADRPFNLNDLKKARALFDKSDVIVATRLDRSANTLLRKFTSLIAFLLVRVAFRVPIDDFHFIQIYRRKILSGIKINSKDTFMPAELLIKLYRKNYKISQFKSKFYKRTAGKSKYDSSIRYLIYLKELSKLLAENSSLAN